MVKSHRSKDINSDSEPSIKVGVCLSIMGDSVYWGTWSVDISIGLALDADFTIEHDHPDSWPIDGPYFISKKAFGPNSNV